MRISGKAIAGLSLLILFLIGAGGTLTLLNWEPVSEPVRTVHQYMPHLSRVFVFILLALLPALALLLSLKQAGERGIILSESPDGILYIKDGAIVKCIRTGLKKIPDVINAQASVVNTPRGIVAKVRAQIRITAGVLPELNRQMRDVVMDTLTRVLGITNVADVKIYIEDIKVSGEETSRLSDIPESEYQA